MSYLGNARIAAGTWLTNRMISWKGKQQTLPISNAENRDFKLGCHGHFGQESKSLCPGRAGVTYTPARALSGE